MGYDIHITRKKNWYDEDGPSISVEEWAEFVNADPEMRLDGYAQTQLPDGQSLRIEREGLSVWVGYSGNDEDGNMAWFLFSNDGVVVKNPDEEILKKMVSIADVLGAKVQGDDGELYGMDGVIRTENSKGEKRPWWKFWA